MEMCGGQAVSRPAAALFHPVLLIWSRHSTN